MNWLKESLGIQEPIYGASAIQSVAGQAKDAQWTELKREDMAWFALNSTTVETQVFYAMTDSGHLCMAQIIYNCLAGIRTTCQFVCKIFYPDSSKPHLWTSDTLDNWKLDGSKTSWTATNSKIELSEDGTVYTITSSTSKQAIVDLKFTRTAPGVMAGTDGTSYYGTDPAKPWGKMHHRFWPRCTVEGSIITQAGEINAAGRGIFIHALQGYRPNLAAASWNFVTFQSNEYSSFIMEFTTPPSYGDTKVTVGAVATDGKILCAGPQEPVKHLTSKPDKEVGWTQPLSAEFKWKGQSSDGTTVSAEMSGDLGKLAERVDVLAQIPKFLKVIIAQAAGSKPFIYQYLPTIPLAVKLGDEEAKKIEGRGYMEATFITG